MDEKNKADIYGAVKLFMRTDRMHRAAVESRVKQLGIHRSQHIVLMYLSKRKTPPTQAEIARNFEISPAAVTTTLKKLEASGLVRRTVKDGNCRANDIEITEKGREIVSESEKLFREVDGAMFEGVAEEDLASFENVLTMMYKNLKELLPDAEEWQPKNESEDDKA